MHAHPDPRRLLASAAVAFALMLVALALQSATADLDLRLNGAGSQAASEAAPAVVQAAPSQPRWLTDPLSPPAFTTR